MAIKNALAGIPVTSLEVAVAWYTKVMDRTPDSSPMPELYEYSLPEGGWMQIFVDPERAGKASVTLVVDDLDGALADLRRIGISATEPIRTNYVDTARVMDPDGNQLVFAQAKSPANKAAS